MLPAFVWSGEDIQGLEQSWSKPIEQLKATKQALATSALFDEFQQEEPNHSAHPG